MPTIGKGTSEVGIWVVVVVEQLSYWYLQNKFYGWSKIHVVHHARVQRG